jgi:uncharacterized membrane protein
MARRNPCRPIRDVSVYHPRTFQLYATRFGPDASAFVRQPLKVIYFTGICEILGAIGLLISVTRIPAAAALILLLVAVLPANIHAARVGVTLRGKPATPLIFRIPMQILFIALTWWSGITHAS